MVEAVESFRVLVILRCVFNVCRPVVLRIYTDVARMRTSPAQGRSVPDGCTIMDAPY